MPCVYRVVDPHGHVIVNRRRTTSGSSRDHHNHGHHMGALAEDPAEEDQMNDDETDSVSNGSTGGNYLLGTSYILVSLSFLFVLKGKQPRK